MKDIFFVDENGSPFPDWEVKKIGDIAIVKNGYAFKSSSYEEKGEYLVTTISNVTGDYYVNSSNSKRVNSIPSDIRPHQVLKPGDILVSLTGNVGRVSIVNEDNLLLNQRVGLIEITDSSIDKNFFYQVLSNKFFEESMINAGQGAAQKNIKKETIENYPISIPSLPEQKKIAEFFSLLDQRIEKQAEKVEALKEYKKGIQQKIFNRELVFTDNNGNAYPEWKKQQLGEVTEVSDGVHFTPTYTTSGVPFWSVETVSSNASPKFISEEAYQKDSVRTAPKYGDILMTRIGTMGKTRLVDWHEKFSIYVSLALIKSHPSFNSSYLNQYFQTSEYKKSLMSKSLTTASPQKINMGDLKETIVQLPSLPEQEKISGFLSALDKNIELNEQKQILLKEQKKGYLQEIFGQ